MSNLFLLASSKMGRDFPQFFWGRFFYGRIVDIMFYLGKNTNSSSCSEHYRDEEVRSNFSIFQIDLTYPPAV